MCNKCKYNCTKEVCGCKNITETNCIKYTGQDLSFLGVVNGDTLESVLVKIDSFMEALANSCED